MVRGLYVAANSLLVQEARNDTIATNLANASTPGYRRAVPSVESFPALLGRAQQALSTADQAVPHLAARQTTDFAPGPQQQTDNPCDVAIDGPGFFVVETPAGQAYTRSGSFALDDDGYLVTAGGHRLLGAGGPIKVTGREWRIGSGGEVACDDAVVDRVRVVDFETPAALSRAGSNLFAAGEAAPVLNGDTSLRQGYIEGSNVNAVSEMVNMIAALRAFEANQKIIQAVDQTLDRAVNEVGRV